ncbi:BadF/BadG/BcrA/BcrD ATPase family protein [Paenibacillus sp.]|uniref:BadF/BadG/BcrA/BcrD ATPase family protein n=1 Tax=Paenibacillus sp. TaxID=58172 RepID=UPI002811672C|nr:BadF/BadG/BcrA/BcrD ATPase family protein [Paenibacillus sp.]
MAYTLGIDGGGTKTELAAISEDGTLLYRTAGASTNPHAVTTEAAIRELLALLEAAFADGRLAGRELTGVCLGLSGVDLPVERSPFETALGGFLRERLGRDVPFALLSEAEISLMAAVGQPYGLLAVSGTGSIVYAVEPDGTRHRAGGWGHLLGDEGSGYAIGVRALKAAMASYDGTIPPTAIAPKLLASLSLRELPELKSYIYQPSIAKADIAAFARLAIDACEAGDAAAVEIVRTEAEALAATAAGLLDRLPAFAAERVAYAGSVFRSSAAFRDAFARALRARHPGVRFEEPAEGEPRTPAEGAALLARSRYSSSHVRGTPS